MDRKRVKMRYAIIECALLLNFYVIIFQIFPKSKHFFKFQKYCEIVLKLRIFFGTASQPAKICQNLKKKAKKSKRLVSESTYGMQKS